MNKWVVLLLMVLAFLAGALSFRSGGLKAVSSSATPIAVADSPTVVEAVSESATPKIPTNRRRSGKDPHFGPPPGRSKKNGEPTPGANKAAKKIAGAAISALVYSTSIDGASRTQFPADTGAIFVTVTPFAVPDKVELVASYRNVLKEDEPFSAPVQSSGPARKRSFRLSAPEGGWPSGPYQLVIKPEGSDQVLTLSRFEIAKAGAAEPEPFPKPEYMDLVSTAEDEDARSVFDQKDPQVGLLINTEGVPESTMVRTIWSAVEVDKLTSGEVVAVSEKAAPGPGKDAFFTFTPREGYFLPGSYRVDIYYDQQEMGSQAFFIQPAAPESASSSPSS